MLSTRFQAVAAFCVFGMGLVYLTLVPPFQAPDEINHLLRAHQLASGERLVWKNGRIGAEFEKSFLLVTRSFDALPFHSYAHTSYEYWLECWQNPFHSQASHQEKEFKDLYNTALYSAVPYLPQIPVLYFAQMAHLHPLTFLYLARFASLSVCCLLLVWSLHLLQGYFRFQLAVLTLFCLPMSLSLAASANPDGFTFALAAVVVAFGLRPISIKGLIGASAAIILLSLCKPVYWPLGLLLLPAVLNAKLSYRRKAFVALWVCLLAVAPFLLWSLVTGSRFTQPSFFPVDPKVQLNLLIHNPWTAVVVFSQDFAAQVPFLITSFIGNLGWLDTPLPFRQILPWCLLLIFSVAVRFDGETPAFSRLRPLAFGLSVAGVLLVCLSIYLGATQVGTLRLSLLQGRYFSPFVLAFQLGLPRFLLLRSCRAQRVFWGVMACIVLLNVFAFITVKRRYWALSESFEGRSGIATNETEVKYFASAETES